MTLVLGLQERERQERAGLAPCCPTEQGVIMRSQAHLGFWDNRIPRKSQSGNEYIPPVLMDTELVTGTSYQTTPTMEFIHCGVNFYTEEKELLFPLLIAITPLLQRIKPKCTIQKEKRAKRQQKIK